jgi:hypothetical protein
MWNIAYSQSPTNRDDFEKYKQERHTVISRYAQQLQEDFKSYRDSINQEYAAYLEKQWKSFNLQKKEPPIKTPIPVPPVYDPVVPKPEPEKVPVIGEPEPFKPLPQEDTTSPIEPQPPVEIPQYPVKANLFGTQIALKGFSKKVKSLAGVSEKEVATYWSVLSKQPYDEWTDDIMRIKADLKLNDWGIYLLINKLFEVYFPTGIANEQVVFTVFMLNQLEYRAKIGRSQNELVPLLAFQDAIYNTSYFIYGKEGNINYSLLNPQHKNLSSVQTCPMDYPNATKNIDLRIETMPHWAVLPRTRTLNDKRNSYEISYNKNLVDFYATYPCVAKSFFEVL